MAAQLKGALFDFDDTLVDWSGVQLGWREIEAARLSRVQGHVFQKTRAYWLTADTLLETYMQRTRAAWSEARVTLRAPHMPSILMETLDALGVATDRLEVDEVIRAYDWNVVPGTIVFPDVPPILKLAAACRCQAGYRHQRLAADGDARRRAGAARSD